MVERCYKAFTTEILSRSVEITLNKEIDYQLVSRRYIHLRIKCHFQITQTGADVLQKTSHVNSYQPPTLNNTEVF